MPKLEVFGAASCPFSQEMRESLEYQNREFLYHDVDADPAARARLHALAAAPRMVPVLVEDGKVVQVGWQGRGCPVLD